MMEWMDALFDKNHNAAYSALKELEKKSQLSNGVYPYMDKLIDMIHNPNSYIRTRGLVLIAANAKWDTDYKIDEIIDQYLKHITDAKPVTARQCIKALPTIAQYKPDLRQDITAALQNADISCYTDSMRPLVYKDIQEALKTIGNLK